MPLAVGPDKEVALWNIPVPVPVPRVALALGSTVDESLPLVVAL